MNLYACKYNSRNHLDPSRDCSAWHPIKFVSHSEKDGNVPSQAVVLVDILHVFTIFASTAGIIHIAEVPCIASS